MTSKKTFRIGLGVCGGIAAYKAVELLRELQRRGCAVSVAMTRHATEFVKPLTFRSLTDEYVLVDDYDPSNPDPIAHINFSQNIDLLLVAPATANTIAKFSNGIADDFLSSTYLACTAPVLLAPAMNTTMLEQPATRRNLSQLERDGVHFVEPASGLLACGTSGAGKLAEVTLIADRAMELLEQGSPKSGDLSGEHFLITVGGTREAIDPVRFISNRSSGRMGFAVAVAAIARGASVTAICGSVSVEPPGGCEVVRVTSAAEMFTEAISRLDDATVFVGAAAVADYRPRQIVDQKIKKTPTDTIQLELEKTEDILAEVSKNRREGQLMIGFAAETQTVVEYGRRKLEAKNLDMVIANDVSVAGKGFDSDLNEGTIITCRNEVTLPLMSKREMADRILDELIALRGIS
jgi:phosphopantothenoylcysteine decarboxylase / phosphopantothenate---cysteine ligase